MEGGVGGLLWAFITIGMVIVLAGGLIYGSVMWRKWKQNPRQAAERDRATRRAYKEPQDRPIGEKPPA